MTSPDQITHDTLAKVINDRAKQFEPGDLHTAKTLIGSDLWNTIPINQHSDVGRMISLLSKQKRIPITQDGFTSSRHNRYVIS